MVFISLDHLGNIKVIESTSNNRLNVIIRSKVDLDPANKPLSACLFNGSKLFAIGRRNGIIDIWSLSECLILKAKSIVSEPVIGLGICEDKLIAIGSNSNIYIMDPFNITKSCIKCHINSKKCICKTDDKNDYFNIIRKIPHQTTVSCVCFSKIAPIIAIVSNSIPTLIDARSGDIIWKAKPRKSSLLKLQRSIKINCICFLDKINQNVIAVGYGDGSIAIYDARIQKRPVYEFILADKRSRGDKKERLTRLHEFDLSNRFPKLVALDQDEPLRPIVTLNLIDEIREIKEINDSNYDDECNMIVTDSIGNISRVVIITGDILVKELNSDYRMDEKKLWESLKKSRKLVKSAKLNDNPIAHASIGPQFSVKIISNYQSHRGAVVDVAIGTDEFITASLDQTCAVYSIKSNKMKQQIHLLEKQSLVLLI